MPGPAIARMTALAVLPDGSAETWVGGSRGTPSNGLAGSTPGPGGFGNASLWLCRTPDPRSLRGRLPGTPVPSPREEISKHCVRQPGYDDHFKIQSCDLDIVIDPGSKTIDRITAVQELDHRIQGCAYVEERQDGGIVIIRSALIALV